LSTRTEILAVLLGCGWRSFRGSRQILLDSTWLCAGACPHGQRESAPATTHAVLRLLRSILPVVLASSAPACGTAEVDPAEESSEHPDGGTSPDGAHATCLIEPDRECPEMSPFPGAPCDGDLSCVYPAPIVEEVTYTCTDGAWEPDCGPENCLMPFSERCDPAFDGELYDATVEIGPSNTATFRPFEPRELLPVYWGPQGLPMIAFRVRVGGVEAPGCVHLHTVLAATHSPESLAFQARVGLRCGESLSVFSIAAVDGLDCEDRDFDLDLRVTVQGLGTTEAPVRLRGGGNCAQPL
jgi:hypothetical protein